MKAEKYSKEKKNAKLKGKKNQKDDKQCRKMWIFKPPGAGWRQKSKGKRRAMLNKKWINSERRETLKKNVKT